MSDESYRVRRGGWYRDPQDARVARGIYYSPGRRFRDLGLRLVEEVEDPEPVPSVSGSNRVIRGGGWDFVPRYARAAIRVDDAPGSRFYDLGFRLVEVFDE